MSNGKLVVIESGMDGSGKTTQLNKLYDRLIKNGYPVHKIQFPDYSSDSSALVKMYLQGKFGQNPAEVNLYAASTFYAVDRFASYHNKWKDIYRDNKIILADRYTTSNMIHQGSKIENIEEKEKYLNWLLDLEFSKFKLPEPDLVIFLNMPPEHGVRLIEERGSQDIHEKDVIYLQKTYKNALALALKYNWLVVDCIEGNEIKPVREIHQEVYSLVKKLI